MSRQSKTTRSLGGATLLAVATAGAVLLAAQVAAGGSTAVAAIVVGQTCSERIPPGTRAAVSATVRNSGDEILIGEPTLVVEGDAGTPENTNDDFRLTYVSGDTNGNRLLDPGETWTFTGGYVVDTEDSTNVVGAETTSLLGNFVSDLEACVTDVIQQPSPGVRAGVVPVRGTVLVLVPGTSRFVPLEHVTEVPIGSQIDTTRGTVRLISAVTQNQTNSAEFYNGLFTIRQRRAQRAVMQLYLGGGNFGVCRRTARSLSTPGVRPRRRVRRVWGNGKGRFETRGRYSAATVRGTLWLTEDRCDGTLTLVRQGSVTVRDLVRRRTVIVRAGRSYLARAPGQ